MTTVIGRETFTILIILVEGQAPDTYYKMCVDLDDYCLSESFILRQSLRGIWCDLCLCNVWENSGATIVLTHNVKES